MIEKPVERAAIETRIGLKIASTKFSIQVLRCPVPRSTRMRAHISGVRVSEIRPEAKIATMIVIANSRKIRPEQSRHENQRNKDRRERERHGKNGEGNFARAVQRGPVNRFAGFRTADDVLQKDNRVIDQESDRKGQRHQGKIVDRIIEHPHREKSHEKRERERDDRNQGVARASEENENDQDDEERRR